MRHIHLDDASTSMTDENGEFFIAIPAGGSDRFVVDVIAKGWVPQSSGVLGSGSVGSTGVGSGSLESLLVELESRGSSVSGRVTTASGSALRGITVLAGVRTQHATVNDGSLPGSIAGPGTGEIRPARCSFLVGHPQPLLLTPTPSLSYTC